MRYSFSNRNLGGFTVATFQLYKRTLSHYSHIYKLRFNFGIFSIFYLPSEEWFAFVYFTKLLFVKFFLNQNVKLFSFKSRWIVIIDYK